MPLSSKIKSFLLITLLCYPQMYRTDEAPFSSRAIIKKQALKATTNAVIYVIVFPALAFSVVGLTAYVLREQMTKIPTTNLNNKKDLQSVEGRDAEIAQILHVLNKTNAGSVLILGPAGVGKTTLLEGLVKKIRDGDYQIAGRNFSNMKDYQFIGIKAKASNAGPFGNPATIAQKFIHDHSPYNKKVFVIDEAHQIDSALLEALKNELDQGLKLLMATTDKNYQMSQLSYQMQNDAMKRRINVVRLDETHLDISFKILKKKKGAENEEELKKIFLASMFLPLEGVTSEPARVRRLMEDVQSEREVSIDKTKKLSDYLKIDDKEKKSLEKIFYHMDQFEFLFSRTEESLQKNREEFLQQLKKVLEVDDTIRNAKGWRSDDKKNDAAKFYDKTEEIWKASIA